MCLCEIGFVTSLWRHVICGILGDIGDMISTTEAMVPLWSLRTDALYQGCRNWINRCDLSWKISSMHSILDQRGGGRFHICHTCNAHMLDSPTSFYIWKHWEKVAQGYIGEPNQLGQLVASKSRPGSKRRRP